MRAVIYLDGEVYATAPLLDDAGEIIIDAGRGVNVVTIYRDGAAVTDADCPSRDCVRAGKASRPGQSICCLPHRLLVRIETAGQGDVDAAAR